jgi:hypothetical protein
MEVLISFRGLLKVHLHEIIWSELVFPNKSIGHLINPQNIFDFGFKLLQFQAHCLCLVNTHGSVSCSQWIRTVFSGHGKSKQLHFVDSANAHSFTSYTHWKYTVKMCQIYLISGVRRRHTVSRTQRERQIKFKLAEGKCFFDSFLKPVKGTGVRD